MQWFPHSVHDQQITSTTMHHKRALAALQAYLRQTKQPWKWKHSFTCTPSWEMQESESKFLTVRQWVLTQGWCGGESLVMGSKKAVKGAETADKIPSHRWQTKAKSRVRGGILHRPCTCIFRSKDSLGHLWPQPCQSFMTLNLKQRITSFNQAQHLLSENYERHREPGEWSDQSVIDWSMSILNGDWWSVESFAFFANSR